MGMCVYMCLRLYLCMSLCMCASVSLYVHMCISASLHFCTCTWICTCTYICMCLCTNIFVGLHNLKLFGKNHNPSMQNNNQKRSTTFFAAETLGLGTNGSIWRREKFNLFSISTKIPSLKLTAKAPENRAFSPKRKCIIFQPSIFGCKLAVSFREGTFQNLLWGIQSTTSSNLTKGSPVTTSSTMLPADWIFQRFNDALHRLFKHSGFVF